MGAGIDDGTGIRRGPHGPGRRDEPGNRRDRRAQAAAVRAASARLEALHARALRPGPGYEVDVYLRDQVRRANVRLASRGWDSLPISHNYVGRFLEASEPMPGIGLVAPRRERSHLFSLADFADWLGSEHAPSFAGAAGAIPEGTVLHYTALPPLGETSIGSVDGHDFAMAGFSMIREGDVVTWYAICGERLSEAEWEKERRQRLEDAFAERSQALPGKEGMPMPEGTGDPTALAGLPFAHRNVLLGMFDLSTARHLSRCRQVEYEEVFVVRTDQPDHFGFEDEEVARSQAEDIDRAEALWSFAQGLLSLPAYFAFKVPLRRLRAVEKGRVLDRQPPDERLRRQREGDRFHVVAAVEVERGEAGTTGKRRKHAPPEVQVEVDGFFRRLSPLSVGRDRNGEPVLGMTWVREHVRWRDRPARPERVRVKASVRAAIERAGAEEGKVERPGPSSIDAVRWPQE